VIAGTPRYWLLISGLYQGYVGIAVRVGILAELKDL
jgi:hypothetical protein